MALNPIAYTEKVVGDFLKYQMTAYPFADQRLRRQLRTLLSLEETRSTPLMKGPYISLSRSFRAGAPVTDLVSQGVLHPFMANLIPHTSLYGHQEKAIRAIKGRRHTLISTGTGSGKTECFLYPIISRCLELRDMKASEGIVAVLVYPMNALAEDQLGRLRGLLAGTGITFGMYIGKTPERPEDVSGEQLRAGASRADYEAALQRAIEEKRETAVHPPEERTSRQEMRESGKQPRILLTNVKQLELLLTRQADVELFDAALLDFLVFDEAHTYGGAAGAETACLIRRLRSFCGRSPSDTICIGTSATLMDERGGDAAREFASRFFGVDAAEVELVGEQYQQDDWAPNGILPMLLPGNPVETLKAALAAAEAQSGDEDKAVLLLEPIIGKKLPPDIWREALYEHLSGNDLCRRLSDALIRPRALSELSATLSDDIGRELSEEEILTWLALGAAAQKGGRPLLRPIVHAFVRGVGGGIVTFPPDKSEPDLRLSAEETGATLPGGELVCLRVMTCTTCGQHYYFHFVNDLHVTGNGLEGGECVGATRFWRPLEESLGGARVVLVDRLVSLDEDDDQSARAWEIFLCRWCGALHEIVQGRCDSCGRQDELVKLQAVQCTERGFLNVCLSCGARGSDTGYRPREPARPVRADTVSDVYILAQNMIHHAERRRLLVFADNRQDAAFQAGWMRDHARRFRIRTLMAERVDQGAISVGDLVAHMDDLLENDDSLSRALIPEVWRIYRKEAEGVRHADERKRFLRILVLRELTTGVKQRFGLEPWGRIRIEYAGLRPDLPFVVEWSGWLAVSHERLVDGIATLLDIQRRGMHLLDREGGIFSRFWAEGETEVQRGYLPLMKGIPKGLKLTRSPGDEPGRVTQWLSQKGETIVRQAARGWGVPKDRIDDFIEGLWALLADDLNILAPVTLKGQRGNALPNCAGVRQIDADKLRIAPHRGKFKCTRCQRLQLRSTPLDRCPAWRCDGTLVWEQEDADDYDIAGLNQGLTLLRPSEHSAQVPAHERERLERLFKGEGDSVNTLVCTPTLELGVDIGALDMVLLRNVPPLPANYWQRAGRAGRRHRLAVNITYSRPRSHDYAYFSAPSKMLEGSVEPPRFNMKNELMLAKHVHSAALSRLFQLSRSSGGLGEYDRRELIEALKKVFPPRIDRYLFDDRGHVRTAIFDISPLRTMISKHLADLEGSISGTFSATWPTADLDIVRPARLTAIISDTPDELEKVIMTLKKRMEWCLRQMERLDSERRLRGTLDPDEDALYRRCDRLVKRFKGAEARRRREAEGQDDINTYGVLSAEGFLPGYGLEMGSILGTAILPKHILDSDFGLPRPPALALQEYIPGNLIYANGHKFVARYFHLEAVEPLSYAVDVSRGAVVEVGNTGSTAAASLAARSIEAIPICDVDLAHSSHITDEEEYRFQLPVVICGYELERHNGGGLWRWGARDIILRKGVHLRLVNIGVASQVRIDVLGYPVCTVCGQSRSPLASQRDFEEFQKSHLERCGRPVSRIGFYSDIVADTLSVTDCQDKDEAYSILETLRMGMARVLEMEAEDLDILVIGKSGRAEVDGLLFDPMPGGSGLLDQALLRWDEVVAAALSVADECQSKCPRSCVDCLQKFRNSFWHKHLDRFLATDRIRAWGEQITFAHELPPTMPSATPRGGSMPVNEAETILRTIMKRAGFPEPEWQKGISLGRPLGSTTPDCYFPGDDGNDPGTCIYLDGLSSHIHGNPVTAQRDREIREELRSRHYEVFEIPASDLTDRDAIARHFFRLARVLLGRDRAKEIKENTGWFSQEIAAVQEIIREPFRRCIGALQDRFIKCVPLLSLQAAAGGFGESQTVEVADWIEPETSRKLREGMFVAQVVGRSMEPIIPDGAYCLFSASVTGSRSGRILLVQHRDIADPETGGTFTVKRYRSDKKEEPDGSWRHSKIRLEPENPEYSPIILEASSEDEVSVIAEFIEVLGETD
jgi:ATP-dependent helicase YprA (DUF1998 family)/SOS-response transcriptional repressor LexA